MNDYLFFSLIAAVFTWLCPDGKPMTRAQMVVTGALWLWAVWTIYSMARSPMVVFSNDATLGYISSQAIADVFYLHPLERIPFGVGFLSWAWFGAKTWKETRSWRAVAPFALGCLMLLWICVS